MADEPKPASGQSVAASVGPIWRILVVTESTIDQKLAAKLIAKHGHLVEFASTCEDAIRKLDDQGFDLVIMDWFLSEGELPQLVQLIRERPNGMRLRILAMTDSEFAAEEWRSHGFDGLTGKPVQIKELTRVMAVGQGESRSCDILSGAGTMSIDWSSALEAVGGQVALLHELVDIFLDEYPRTMDEIRSAIAGNHPKELQLSAHKLKGCLRYFGPNPAAEIAQQLEDMGRSSQLNDVAVRVNELDLAIQRLIPLLKAPE